MTGVSKAVSESLLLKAKEALKELGGGSISRKVQAIISAKYHGIKKVSEVFGISRTSLMSWIKIFEKRGVEGLKIQAGRGRKRIIVEEARKVIRNWIFEDSNITIKKLQKRIKEEFGKELCRSSTHELMQHLKFSYITPRPKHYKQNKQLQDEFKKKAN
jgi:transposase